MLFTDAIILPDLHRLAAARARIAVAGDDDGLLSFPLPVQLYSAIAVARLGHRKAGTPATCERSQSNNSRNKKLEFGRHVAVGRQILISRPIQISVKTGVVHAIVSSLLDLRENNRAEEHGTASIVAADERVALPPDCERQVQATAEPYACVLIELAQAQPGYVPPPTPLPPPVLNHPIPVPCLNRATDP